MIAGAAGPAAGERLRRRRRSTLREEFPILFPRRGGGGSGGGGDAVAKPPEWIVDENEAAERRRPDHGGLKVHPHDRGRPLRGPPRRRRSLHDRRSLDDGGGDNAGGPNNRTTEGRRDHEAEAEEEDEKMEALGFSLPNGGESSSLDSYYAFDDDYLRAPVKGYGCRRVSWHRLHRPNCNGFHEIDLLGTSYDDEDGEGAEGNERRHRNRIVGKGHFRNVFRIYDVYPSSSKPGLSHYNPVVLKTNRMKSESSTGKVKGHDVNHQILEFARMDALVMERLTSSDKIVNVYGHCGTSVVTESLGRDLESVAIRAEGWGGHISREELNDVEDVRPQNDLSPASKLALGLMMAEALAELHGFEDGVIVHDDVQLSQFLFSNDRKTLKLNDFNRAEVMLYSERVGKYCRYRNDGGFGNYRAPEEWADRPLNEKIDVYSFGNNLYGLLTGLEPFYDVDDDGIVHERMINGTTAYVDPRYANRSVAERKLVELIERCWIYDVDERISIFDAVEFLRDAVIQEKEEQRRRKRRAAKEEEEVEVAG